MPQDTRKNLLALLAEYHASLDRIQGEKELLKCIEARAITECGMKGKAFKVVAMAHWKDQAQQVCEDLDTQLAAFEQVRGEEVTA